MSKTVAEIFDLMPTPEQKQLLIRVARTATFAENAIWMLWRTHDPVSSVDMVEMADVKQATGKWPKLPQYVLADVTEGETPTKIAANLCPGLYSYVYDAIANHVRKQYSKKRFAYLRFDERLPVARDLRIRFRERAVAFRRSDRNPNWFQVGLRLLSGEIEWFDMRPCSKSDATMEWLGDMADGRIECGSGGTVSSFKRKGKLCWQVSQARGRRDGERAQVDPIGGRFLTVWAPFDQDVFMWCEVNTEPRPWRMEVESNDLCVLKHRHEQARASMGRNYHQSRFNGAHGHGRNRAIRGKMPFSARYENRVNNWIENRSMTIVQFCIKTRCGELKMEDLSAREPSSLRLGSFPYFKLMARVENKCKEAGIKFSKFNAAAAKRAVTAVEV